MRRARFAFVAILAGSPRKARQGLEPEPKRSPFGAPEFYTESGRLIRTPFSVRSSDSPRRQLAIESSQDVIQGII